LGSIHDLEVHVRLAGIARVAAVSQLRARVNMLTGADEQRSPTQVGYRGVRVIAEVEDDMVTEQSLRPSQLAKCAFDHQIDQARP
jgi:ppGpp synthetase/RelA/SpoT-type nucleotidyltranferase